ncbi:MAG TPA: alginate lyase family protein [Blastocatellia bacterium]|nr:alginate lyase family protein [Blastocatellia bacterium]
MTIRELAGEASHRAGRRISRAISRASDSPQSTYVSDADLRRSLGRNSIADVASRIRTSPHRRLVPGLADLTSTVAAVKELFPDSIEQSRFEAEAILDHRITLFGRAFELGPKIDWHRDPQADVRWPLSHFTRVPLVLVHGADVRVVWELNRLHHLVALGRAYLLTSDERYSEEFLLQLASWYEDNPPRFGVNWSVAMEAGIRAVNIIAALEVFRGSPNVSDQAIELILKMLLAHGRFIRANLEFSYRTPSNHYLSDLIGLFAIAETVPELREARGWRDYSAPRLVKEMNRQVLADGVDYEVSTGYHRFVLEIFSLFFSLCRTGDFDPGTAFHARLEAMFDFVRCYLKPDGAAPAIGDSDDGRLIRFKSRPPVDHSYLMSIGAILDQNGAFKQSSEIDEEAIWWFGQAGLETFERLPINERAAGSRAFLQAQIFVQRAGDLYSVIDCGDHGARGRGSHAHSDALSIEVFAFNRTFVRDPGTYVYTASEQERNLFRSTAYHNTVRVDGKEISQVNEGELFAFASNVRPHVNLWESTSERDVLDVEHYAYRRLASPVTHRRVVTLDKRECYWIIRDIFTGAGGHRFEFFFNFDAGLEVTIDTANRAIARGEQAALTIVPVCDHKLEAKIEPRWISPAYGTRLNSSAIIYSLTAEAPLEVSFQLQVSRS